MSQWMGDLLIEPNNWFLWNVPEDHLSTRRVLPSRLFEHELAIWSD
jgi:hypothetical protein